MPFAHQDNRMVSSPVAGYDKALEQHGSNSLSSCLLRYGNGQDAEVIAFLLILLLTLHLVPA